MTDSRDRFSGTMPIRAAHQLDLDALQAYLEPLLGAFPGPVEAMQFKGGQSNPTYLLNTGQQQLVLRRKPPGKLLASAHAVDREHRVISALAQTPVPVPEAIHCCNDSDVIGTAFYLMEYVEGRIFWDAQLRQLPRDQRAAIYQAMSQVLAELHLVDYRAVGLEDFGRPDGYIGRQVARWSKQYRASETEPIEAMDRLIEWLPAHLPEQDQTSIVHGDFRLDNLVFHPTEPRVIAVLDWELSTIGNPLADIAYHCLTWHLEQAAVFPGLAGLDHAGLGLPTEAQQLADYCRHADCGPIANWEFYIAYNLFRAAAIFQGIAKRVVDGTAASAHAAQMGALAAPVAQTGWRLLRNWTEN